MRADYITPLMEGHWHQNDFPPDYLIVVDGHKFTVKTSRVNEYGDVELTGEWEDQPNRDPRVWPNMQWVALNWEEDDDA